MTRPYGMPFIDTAAAARVRELREAQGLSPEALAREIAALARREGWRLGTVDAFTIRRIEGTALRAGRVPSIRVQCVVASFFEMAPHEIWRPANRVRVEAVA